MERHQQWHRSWERRGEKRRGEKRRGTGEETEERKKKGTKPPRNCSAQISIYSGRTRAEWQASNVYLEQHCARSDKNKHTFTYAYWFTSGINFLSFYSLSHQLSTYMVQKSSPAQEQFFKQIERPSQQEGGRHKGAEVEGCWSGGYWHIIWQARLNLCLLKKSQVLGGGGGSWQQINNIGYTLFCTLSESIATDGNKHICAWAVTYESIYMEHQSVLWHLSQHHKLVHCNVETTLPFVPLPPA